MRVARDLRPDVKVLGQTRKGKGNALACGFAAASGDFIVMLDADGSTDPAEIPRFVNALKEGADFAKGSRFMPGAGSSDISRVRQMGNYWLNKMVNLLYGTRYTDLCYGYNAFRRECLSVIDLEAGEFDGVEEGTMLWGDGFEVETLINVRIAKAGLRVAEVPSFERRRYFGTSNLNAVSDGIRVMRTIHSEVERGHRGAVSSSEFPAGGWGFMVGTLDARRRGELTAIGEQGGRRENHGPPFRLWSSRPARRRISRLNRSRSESAFNLRAAFMEWNPAVCSSIPAGMNVKQSHKSTGVLRRARHGDGLCCSVRV